MPVVVNSQSGLAEDLPEDQAAAALKEGSHHIPLNDPEGNPATAPLEDAPRLIQEGYSQPAPEQLQSLVTYGEKSSTGQQALTALEGAGVGMTFGLSTGLERLLGVNPEDIRQREEVNPGIHALGEMGGLGVSMLYGAGEAALLGKAGKAAAGLAGLGEATGFVGGAGRALVKGAVETAMMAGGDEVSHFLASDPHQSWETAASHVGAAALLGGGIGGGMGLAFGAVNPLWKAVSGSKVSQLVQDFRGRVQQHMNNPNPTVAVQEQLGSFYKNIKEAADDVYGATGIKAQEIQKLVPEMNEKIGGQAQKVWDHVSALQKEMSLDPDVFPIRLQNQFAKDARIFQETLTKPGVSSAETFNAIQRMKQVSQDWAKGYVAPIDEGFGFVQKMKELAPILRTELEDAAVWGKAAERQQAINAAFVKFKPALQDFEKRFTTKIGGVAEIDPGKIQTYMNQLGNPNAELKQSMLKNFRDAADKYSQVIHESHANLGIESPIVATAMNAVDDTLGKLSAGSKLADAMIKKGLAKSSGGAMGAGVGALAGGGWGALIGEHVLGPLFESVLPGIVKPLLEKAASAEGFKSAIDLGLAVKKGEMLLNSGAKAVFQHDKQVIPESLKASEGKLSRLRTRLTELQKDSTSLLDVGGHTGHYLPDHQVAMGTTAARAVSYLQTLKPTEDRAAPLDAKKKPNGVQEAKYTRALTLVQQPMTAVQHLKEGRLNSDDMKTLAAVYPAWLARMQSKLTAEMIQHQAKGHVVPYQTRLGLSLFLGTPLDSTMTPEAMQFMRPPAPPEAPPIPKGSKPNQSGLNKLGKVNNLYRTPNQQAESRRMVK